MGIVETVTGQKHTFDGIGKGGATLAFLALASSPATLWMTQGIAGKILFWVLTKASSWGASQGLVILNVGIAKIQVIGEQKDFDGSFDEAFRIINSSGGKLTDEQIKAIDDKVKKALERFADMSKS